jgi:hypothetical protein
MTIGAIAATKRPTTIAGAMKFSRWSNWPIRFMGGAIARKKAGMFERRLSGIL